MLGFCLVEDETQFIVWSKGFTVWLLTKAASYPFCNVLIRSPPQPLIKGFMARSISRLEIELALLKPGSPTVVAAVTKRMVLRTLA